MNFYSSAFWKRLSRTRKERDGYQCQLCGDRKGDPYCELHAHHIVRRSDDGPDSLDNLITLCDLCHAVVTRRWRRPWFPTASIEEVEAMRVEFEWFLHLPVAERRVVQRDLWRSWGWAEGRSARPVAMTATYTGPPA
jgi:hypothetical protein